jgi:histidine phosphotransferase ChpT
MRQDIGIRIFEMACSRICHDLVGAIGAVNNGVELIAEDEDAADNAGDDGKASVLHQALGLIAESAGQAGRRLALFRLALGSAGGQRGFRSGDARQALFGWLEGGRITLEWREGDIETPVGALKMLLLAGLLAEESLPRGGKIAVSFSEGVLRLEASGQGCALRPEAQRALAGTLSEEETGPRAALAYVAPKMAAAYGLRFETQLAPGQVVFIIAAADEEIAE